MPNMPPVAESRQSSQANDEGADELRSRMYGDREFMAGIRRGLQEESRGEGMTVEEYVRSRGIE